MKRFILVSFIFMGWAYYEMSGGADFVAETWPEEVVVADARLSTSGAPDAVADPLADIQVATVTPPPTAPLPTAEIIAVAETASAPLAEEPTFVSLVAPEVAVPAAAPNDGDFRSVDANRLNVRQGPSTNDGVVGQITRGEIVAVIEEQSDGWSLIRIEGDGVEGWVATRFLVR